MDVVHFGFNVVATNLPEQSREAGLTPLLRVEPMIVGVGVGVIDCTLRLHAGRRLRGPGSRSSATRR